VESEVRNKVLGGEDLHGGGTGVVTGVEPMLNTGAIVCDAGAETYGRLHYVERDRTAKEAGYSYAEFVSSHSSEIKKKKNRERGKGWGQETEGFCRGRKEESKCNVVFFFLVKFSICFYIFNKKDELEFVRDPII